MGYSDTVQRLNDGERLEHDALQSIAGEQDLSLSLG